MPQRQGLRERSVALRTLLWRAVDWVVEGIELTLPHQWRYPGGNGTGTSKQSSVPGGQLSPIIEMPAKRLFWASIHLPKAAASHHRQAVGLRFPRLCPITPEDAVYAVGSPSPAAGDQVVVPVVIARRSDVAELTRSNDNLQRVVARAEGGRPLTLYRRERKKLRRALVTLAGAYGAIISALFAVSTYTERWVERSRVDFARLTSQVKDWRQDQEAIYLYVDETRPFTSHLVRAAASDTLYTEHGAVLTSIVASEGVVTVEGFLPPGADTTVLNNMGELTLIDEERDGWRSFAMAKRILYDD